jgi:hypothetical protein
MTNYINVYNLDTNTAWKKHLTNEEFSLVKGYVKGESTIAIIPAAFKPIRTNNLKNFSKDFFLPTTINHAIKVQHVALKIFSILASLVLDVLTFPIRFLTCIPRVISNARRTENLLLKYLRAEGVDKKILESGHVRVRLGWEKTSQYPTSHWTTKDGVRHSSHSQDKHWREKDVNFIEVPMYEGSDHFAWGKTSSGMNSERPRN